MDSLTRRKRMIGANCYVDWALQNSTP